MIDKELIAKYKNASEKLILLDYDGTLVNIKNNPVFAIPDKRLIELLNNLNKKPGIKLIIITGRSYQEIDSLIGKIPIDIIANHGAMIKINNKWIKTTNDKGEWKEKILSIMTRFKITCHKSFIEEKDFSLVWHYRNSEPEIAYAYSRVLISMLEKNIDAYDLKILDGKMVVEVMKKEISKGKTIEKIILEKDYQFILSIGDDITDEEMFNFLLFNDNAVTIKVGDGQTIAKKRCNNVEDVILLLEQLLLN